MWYAFILACGSSTDNLAVGFASGISKRQLNISTNIITSFLNAMGAYLSAAGGHMLGELAPTIAILFATIIFAYLAVDELLSWRNGDKESTMTMKLSDGILDSRLGIPMTLNNLAGGVAGGAVGVHANTAGFMALLASFCMMKIGHSVGLYLNTSVKIDTRVISGSIFACLAFTQL